jgi:hypothetical protein
MTIADTDQTEPVAIATRDSSGSRSRKRILTPAKSGRASPGVHKGTNRHFPDGIYCLRLTEDTSAEKLSRIIRFVKLH